MKGNIYFVRCRRFVKVGFAIDVKARIKELQCGNPFQLEVMAVLEVDHPIVERWFHDELGKYRVRGEWFRLTRKVREFIELIKGGAMVREPHHIRLLLGLPEAMQAQRNREEYARSKSRRVEDLFYVEIDDLNRTGAKI